MSLQNEMARSQRIPNVLRQSLHIAMIAAADRFYLPLPGSHKRLKISRVSFEPQ
jgi:hypothetical protein